MGRPAGSLNRKTLRLGAYLESLGHRDPAVVLAELASMPMVDLKRLAKGKDGAAALAARIRAAEALMPYLHGKMPVRIESEGALPVLQLLVGTNQIEQFQTLKDVTPPEVARPEVARKDQPLENKQLFDE